MMRLFTDTNDDGENVLLLDYTSKWTIEGNPSMYVIGDTHIGGYKITGDAVDRFAELEKSAPRWISAEERLPPLPKRSYASVTVITYCKMYANKLDVLPLNFTWVECKRKSLARWEYLNGRVFDGEVLCWQPLPAPPNVSGPEQARTDTV